MANFNRIARTYDFWKWIVFGNQLEKAANHFLNHIPSKSKILIIGGGTGQILKNFDISHQIKYLELSSSMIKKAKSVEFDAKIDFIQADVLEWHSDVKFDFIITPFILDCLTEKQLNLIFPKLKNLMNKDGKWIQTDFYPKTKIQRFLVRMMYNFFRFTANLKTNQLIEFDLFFKKHRFICQRKALFYHSVVESKIYQNID
ncbi:class I SAM-dependent methyltransferase [Marivirga sp.]|uniref:class I SAM-dependent methyltransferase n=1 Tax=Marivirga sp. TaxID=2018662 RepID=UPI002D80C47B|nr:class I SAM-dependent methyltransferase [Marivirga sp.]HET8859464.1 class I SAM-dependent methyltransferase [Marivirga sp.]